MPRKTPVKELLKEEEIPSSPLRRSSRISSSSPAPTKVISRRNSSSETTTTTTSTPKATRGRRSSLSQEPESTNDAPADKRKSTSTIRTRRSSLTQNNDDRANEEPTPKTRTRGSSVPKESQVVEVKKTTRRRRSVTDESEEETVTKSARGSSSSKKTETSDTKSTNKKAKDVSAGTPVKKAASISPRQNVNGTLESIEEDSKEKESLDRNIVKSVKKRKDDPKIELDLSVINEASLTDEEISPQKKSFTEVKEKEETLQDAKEKLETHHETEKNTNTETNTKDSISETDVKLATEKKLIVVLNKSIESPVTKDVPEKDDKDESDSNMSDGSFKLQLDSSNLENNQNADESGNKENVSPKKKFEPEPEEPMDIDEPEIVKAVPPKKTITPSRFSLAKKFTEVEHKLQVTEKITDEIDQFLKEDTTFSTKNKTETVEVKLIDNANVSSTVIVEEVIISPEPTPIEKTTANKSFTGEEEPTEKSKGIPLKEKENEQTLEEDDNVEIDFAMAHEVEVTTETMENEESSSTTEVTKNDSPFKEANITEPSTFEVEDEHETAFETPANQKSSPDELKEESIPEPSFELEISKNDFVELHNKSVSNEITNALEGKSVSSHTEEEKIEDITVVEKTVPSEIDTEIRDDSESDLLPTKSQSDTAAESDNSKENILEGEISINDNLKKTQKTDIRDTSTTKTEENNQDSDEELILAVVVDDEQSSTVNEDEVLSSEVEVIDTDNQIHEDADEVVDFEESQSSEDNENEETYKSPVKKLKTTVNTDDDEIPTNKGEEEEIDLERSLDSKYSVSLRTQKSEKSQSDLDSNQVSTSGESETEEPIDSQIEESIANSNSKDEIRTITQEGSKNKFEEKEVDDSTLSNSTRKRSFDRNSITLQETVKAGENKEKAVSERIHKVVDLFCAGLKNTSDVSINVSLEYTGQITDSEDEKTDLLEVSLTASSSIPENETVIKKGSKRRKICHDQDAKMADVESLKKSKSPEKQLNQSEENSSFTKQTDSPKKKTSPTSKMSPKLVSSDENDKSPKKNKKRMFLNTSATLSDANNASPNMKTSPFKKEVDLSSTEKNKRRKSLTREPEPNSESKIKKKNSLSFDQNLLESSTESRKKRRSLTSDATDEESSISLRNNKKVGTPFRSKVQISSDDGSSSDKDSEDDAVDDSVSFQLDPKYKSLLASSFEESDLNDTTWRPDDNDDDTECSNDWGIDESETEPEESFLQAEKSKSNASRSNHSVFEEEPVEKKIKKRKMFRLSRFNMSEALTSSESEGNEKTKKNTILKKSDNENAQTIVKEKATKKNKQEALDFEETEVDKSFFPQSSEVANKKYKNKKRKFNVDQGREIAKTGSAQTVTTVSKTNRKKQKVTDLREKLNRFASKNEDFDRGIINTKPSRKAHNGWQVSAL